MVLAIEKEFKGANGGRKMKKSGLSLLWILLMSLLIVPVLADPPIGEPPFYKYPFVSDPYFDVPEYYFKVFIPKGI